MTISCWRNARGLFLGLALSCFALPASAQTPAPAPPPAASRPADALPALSPRETQPAATVPPANETVRPLANTGHMPRDLSPWSMFLSADVVVKAVMVSLGFASLVTWTIFFAKLVQLARARHRLGRALARIADARTLAAAQLMAGTSASVLSSLLKAAIVEMRLSGDDAREEGIKERAASRFSEIARAEARSMRQGMAMLATIGATSPFVGLFGTVWGIMNSFIGISKSQTTNLAVVAPGIAEALLATAIGLIAAIPAVIVYNYFSRVTKAYLELVGRGSGAVGRLLSRDLDHGRGRLTAHAAE